ncbi:unnamed protein product, partial [Discosporangium mesarthrocarpum]
MARSADAHTHTHTQAVTSTMGGAQQKVAESAGNQSVGDRSTGDNRSARGDRSVSGADRGEVAGLRARLAKLEARNAELEEGKFELEASMQLIEAEADHRVKKERRQLESELAFKAHQLSLAQGQCNKATKELEAERGRRKRDHEQMEGERAKAAASAAKAAADAAEAAAGADAAAKAAAAIPWGLTPEPLVRDQRLPARTPALAGAILSELSDDALVLLNPTISRGPWRSPKGYGSYGTSLGNSTWGQGGAWPRTPKAHRDRADGAGAGA